MYLIEINTASGLTYPRKKNQEVKMPKKRLKKPALVVVDMQRYFLDPEADAFLKDGPAIVGNVKRILNTFRKKGLPVIFTRHAHKKGEPTGQMGRWWNDKLPWDGEAGSEIVSALEPLGGEMVVTKARYSAFERTAAAPYLKGRGVETVVICGVMTHLCVETSARHAFLLDLEPVVVSDACATQSKEHHEASLLNLAHGFAHIVDTKTLLSLL